MKITYLGTAAAEGFPGIFCNCKYCNKARELGGKNIRTRSQTLINDDLLIDLPADTYSHFLKNNIRGDTIKYLLITHSHQDHLYEQELNMRLEGYANNIQEERLKLYCNNGAFKRISALPLKDRIAFDCKVINAFETVKAGRYSITALPARHAAGDDALIYIIHGEKTILYAHDTGYFYDEVFDYIKNNSLAFDLISMDCTNIDIEISDEGNHMGLDNIKRATERLNSIGAIKDNTKKIINHFSHNAAPLHEELEKKAKKIGYEASFDSLVVEI